MKPTRILLLIAVLLLCTVSGKLIDVVIIKTKDNVHLKDYVH